MAQASLQLADDATRRKAMVDEPYSRQDALDLFSRITEAGAFGLFALALAKSIVLSERGAPASRTGEQLLAQAADALEEAIRTLEKLPATEPPLPEIARQARGMLSALRANVAYWRRLCS